MGRVAADLTKLLPQMEAAREEVEPGQIVTMAKLAAMIGTTPRILKDRVLRDKKFPVVERGADGKQWRLDAAKALDYLLSKTGATKRKRIAGAAERKRLAGFADSGESAEPAIAAEDAGTPDAVDEATQARGIKALAEARMLTHRLKVQQGEYVRADAVTNLLLDLMTTMQVETLGISAKLDPAGKWPVETRASVEAGLRDVLLHVQRKLDAKLVNGRVRLD